MKQELILIRGLPGSGKTTLAIKAFPNYIHLENDMWHIIKGKYKFSNDELENAFTWCELTAEYNIRLGKSVVVSNTFITNSHMKPYFEIAKKYKIPIRVIELQGYNFGSIHNVPEKTFKSMKKNWETLKM